MHQLRKEGHMFTLTSTTTDNILREYESFTFEKSFPLQFPYGIGGRHDAHEEKRGKNAQCALEQYLEYLVDRARPCFQFSEFLLVLCNIKLRQRALRFSGFQVNCQNWNELFVKNVCLLEPEELTRALENAVNGVHGNGTRADELVRTLKAVCKALPHTNDAAKDARSQVYSMSVKYGQPAVFFTISPDDLHNLRTQVYFNAPIDMLNEIDSLSDEELSKRNIKRAEFRVRYPGCGSHDFENSVNAVIEAVFGWNIAKEESYAEGGFFGKTIAFVGAVEEQGRKSLHIHFAVFLQMWAEIMETLGNLDTSKEIQSKIEEQLAKWFEKIGSTELIPLDYRHRCNTVKHCDSQVRISKMLIDDQSLRCLRHKEGCKKLEGIFAKCTTCFEAHRPETLMHEFLKRKGFCKKNIDLMDTNLAYLELKRMQMMLPIFDINNASIVNATVNLHASYHKQQCFKQDPECRHRFPAKPSSKTVIEPFDEPQDWFKWTGEATKRFIYKVTPKRSSGDLYMNCYSPVISESILACNSNISPIFTSRYCIYMTNYLSKGTQEDDSDSYKRDARTVKRRFGYHVHEVEKSEAISRLLSCVFSHTRAHVISAPLARYLIKNNSRFVFSHRFVHIPLATFNNVLLGKKFEVTLRNTNGFATLNSRVINYIFRPKCLENVSVYDFFTSYDVVRVNKQKTKRREHFDFDKNHPEFGLYGIKRHFRKEIAKFSSWLWPDTKRFKGSIFEVSCYGERELNAMDEFAKYSLILFFPFRCLSDLMTNNTFRHKFVQAEVQERIGETGKKMLQNIQNIRNSMHLPCPEEALVVNTEMCGSKKKEREISYHEMCMQEELDLIDELVEEGHEQNITNPFHKYCLDTKNLTFECLNTKGKKGITKSRISSITYEENSNFITNEKKEAENFHSEEETRTKTVRSNPTLETLISVAAQRKTRNININDKDVKVMTANGTAGSIIDWAKKHKLDKEQRLAFYTMTSSFVLTYVCEAMEDHYNNAFNENSWIPSRSVIQEHVKLLQRLNGQKELRLFVSGAGGTGKSKVIDHVVAYSKNFCENIHAPFTDRTIVVTALTGVAAVLIKGETLHSASHVFCNHINQEMIDSWSDARLVIVDEISFADTELLEEINAALRDLMECPSRPYGGLNMAFVGDFRQLEPVKMDPLYRDTHNPIWHKWINNYIELTTNHRAKEDPACARLLERFRNGNPNRKDIDLINARVLSVAKRPPKNTRYACYTNQDRCAINNALFIKHLKDTHSMNENDPVPMHTIIIGASNATWESRLFGSREFKFYKILYEKCSEADCKIKKNGRIDPCLKLYSNCPIMLTENRDVRRGEANGCPCRVKKIVLKDDVIPEKKCVDGYCVNFVSSADALHIEAKSEIDVEVNFYICACHRRATVTFPQPDYFHDDDAKEKFTCSLKMRQFPVHVNNATTGHKLQGTSLDALMISSWSYTRNWP